MPADKAKTAGVSTLSAKPELIVAGRSAAATSLSTNPELIVAQRFANQ